MDKWPVFLSSPLMNRILPVIIAIFLGCTATAQNDTIALETASHKLIVGIKEAPPFIIKDRNDVYSGISVELWREIAAQMGVEYELKPYDGLEDVLAALKNDEIDISINPLTVTSSRLLEMDFTQPFFITHLAVVNAPNESNRLWAFLKNLLSWHFLQGVILLLLVIMSFGLIVWVFERKKNKEQFSKGMKGVGDGFWWSAVTMTTVGYGDKAPVTVAGRVIGLIWMFTAIIIISGFTASIASSLTVSNLQDDISNIKDLRGFSVGTIPGSSSEEFLDKNGIYAETFGTVDEGLDAVLNKDLEIFVYDAPILKFQINQGALARELNILPKQFQQQYYSFALPKGSPLRDQINPVLLDKIGGIGFKAMLSTYSLDEG